MVNFRLNDEGDLELKQFCESCRDSILENAYPRLLEAMSTAPTGEPNAEGVAVRKASEEERTRPLKPTRVPKVKTEAAMELQKKLGASAAYANRAVQKMASGLLEKTPTPHRKQ